MVKICGIVDDTGRLMDIPSGNLLHSYGKSPFSMGKSTISMVIFYSYVKLPEGMNICSYGMFIWNVHIWNFHMGCWDLVLCLMEFPHFLRCSTHGVLRS